MALQRRVRTVESGVHICCADRPIGTVGLLVAGDCVSLHADDVWSFPCSDGTRLHYDAAARLDVNTQGEYEHFCAAQIGTARRQDYCEAIVRDCAVIGVWVKVYADDKTKRAARLFARTRGVKFFLMPNGRVRIWDLLDNHTVGIYA